jgi:uncharacterized protein (TIGR03435 family)
LPSSPQARQPTRFRKCFKHCFSLTFAAETDAGLPQGFQRNPELSEPALSLSEEVKKYGLRIEPRKETIDMFVVAHVEKTPTEN